MVGKLESRVAKLEARSPNASGALLVVGPYAAGDDPAPHVEAAREGWRRRFGDWPPADVRALHVCLCGKIAEGENDAR